MTQLTIIGLRSLFAFLPVVDDYDPHITEHDGFLAFTYEWGEYEIKEITESIPINSSYVAIIREQVTEGDIGYINVVLEGEPSTFTSVDGDGQFIVPYHSDGPDKQALVEYEQLKTRLSQLAQRWNSNEKHLTFVVLG